MPWMKEYYVSYIQITKSRPIKVKVNSKEEAQDAFRKIYQDGGVEEEEISFQINIQENLKKY